MKTIKKILLLFSFLLLFNISKADDYSKYVWAIVKIEAGTSGGLFYNNSYNGNISIIGSCFPINDSLFVSAYHVYKGMVSTTMYYSITKCSFVNEDGKRIDSYEVYKSFPEKDIIIFKVKHNIKNLQYLKMSSEFSLKTEVANIGFPSQFTYISKHDVSLDDVVTDDSFKGFNYKPNSILESLTSTKNLTSTKKEINIKVLNVSKPVKVRGTIQEICNNCDYEGRGIKLEDVMYIRANYICCPGFSGGPLIKKKDSKVIGIVSFVDETNEYNLCAISIQHIKDLF